MCGSVGGCGGAATQTPVQQSIGGGHAHAMTQSMTAAPMPTGSGAVYGAWGTNATFQVTQSHMQDHHGKVEMHQVLQRTSAVDLARAQRVMQAALQLIEPVRYEDTQPALADQPNGDHRKVPQSVKDQWAALFPDLGVPNVIVYDKSRTQPIGVMFVGGDKAKDLGMGSLHMHSEGGAIMQHMWLIPDNFELAFSDTTQKSTAMKAATEAMT